jgi:hypothetical protein
MSRMDYVDNRDEQGDLRDGWIEQQHDQWVRDRIAEVLRKYSVILEAAPLDALTDAMRRIGAQPRSLLHPSTVAPKSPDITTPEGAKQASKNAAWYRRALKPFA